MFSAYRWGHRQMTHRVVIVDPILQPFGASPIYPRSMLLPNTHSFSRCLFLSNEAISLPADPSTNTKKCARRPSILIIRRKKMNKHKWKKLRRRYRDSNRYNRSKKKRNRDRLREEAKELGLEF